MFRTVDDVPLGFDGDFLDWFRQRTETTWEALPVRTPEDTLAEFVKAGVGGSAWQPGTRWLGGMDDAEIAEAERRWRLTFPPDYHFFLQHLHSVDRPMLRASYVDPIPGMPPQTPPGTLAIAQVKKDDYMVLRPGASFYNWQSDTEALEERFAWLWEGLQFDVEHNDLWLPQLRPECPRVSTGG